MFCNIDFRLLNKQDMFNIDSRKLKHIVTVNAQFIVLANTDERFMHIVNDNYASFDGEVPYRIAKFLGIYRNVETLKGSEIIYDFARFASERNMRIFLLGGCEDSNIASVNKMKEIYGVQAEGYSPPYENYPFSEKFNANCMEEISRYRPDILFVGFGAPKQEYFIDDNYKELNKMGIKYVIGCGGTFDFFSGKIKRAPKFISKIGLESVYRLFQEMNFSRFKRILISCVFFKYIFSKPEFRK